MASFDAINYNLRPSKSVQRHIIFSGIREIHKSIDIVDSIYIGFGSIWFTDFVLAHKILGVSSSISIELNEIGYKRAKFNAPFSSVTVIHGHSSNEIPKLIDDETAKEKPWVMWLDYDFDFNETIASDVRLAIESAPANTFFIITFNCLGQKYGKPNERPERIKSLLGPVVPDTLSKKSCKDEKIAATLADLVLDYMTSIAQDISRPGGFIPSVRVIYRDGAPMVTLGGFLPSAQSVKKVAEIINGPAWQCKPRQPIVIPHLTMKEAICLQSTLPSLEGLTREKVQSLGFDLEDSQIEAFEKYYLHYPSFAQIIG